MDWIYPPVVTAVLWGRDREFTSKLTAWGYKMNCSNVGHDYDPVQKDSRSYGKSYPGAYHFKLNTFSLPCKKLPAIKRLAFHRQCKANSTFNEGGFRHNSRTWNLKMFYHTIGTCQTCKMLSVGLRLTPHSSNPSGDQNEQSHCWICCCFGCHFKITLSHKKTKLKHPWLQCNSRSSMPLPVTVARKQ